MRVCLPMAEDMRFELTEACTSPPFQDGALNRSANPPTASLIIAKNKSFVTRKSKSREKHFDAENGPFGPFRL